VLEGPADLHACKYGAVAQTVSATFANTGSVVQVLSAPPSSPPCPAQCGESDKVGRVRLVEVLLPQHRRRPAATPGWSLRFLKRIPREAAQRDDCDALSAIDSGGRFESLFLRVQMGALSKTRDERIRHNACPRHRFAMLLTTSAAPQAVRSHQMTLHSQPA
jgi:hypothetical protein